ncbi:phenylacetate-CoA ligase [Winogradskyella epiphytica]|uniref:Phenylacetate-CoA ligase n=1 Tax=Winogradskyella epiphytica TaxID=262005 RepID=A0A2V4XER5_9FLAO|nr:phenylacetate--CoA ligase family protein [Winogradskyella epiphytica]PYE81545.1 phenylacetate-CoA ligase [Winogradskyella epiphytica]GGW64391.1 capsular polysaccharide biosynthesis protein [Winogradskyella epiphytica]
MSINKIRSNFYWLIDALKGKTIKSQLKDIEFCLENAHTPQAKEIQKAHIQRLLKHVTQTTPFYKKFKGLNDIHSFPVIRKTVIQDDFENFKSSSYKDKKNFKVSTSGSTGVPFLLYQNQEKRNRNHADLIYYYKQSNFKIGNRLYELEVWRNHNKKGKLKSWLQNIVQFDISRLTDDRIQQFLKLLKLDKQSDKTMLGFASAYELIAQYLENNNIILDNVGLTSAIANAEYLNHYTKTTLGKHLNTVVLSRYSSEEIGVVAQQTLSSPNTFVLNHASYYVELLNLNSDIPAKPGEFGRIVVTDLFNYAMPIIRYDTGDIAEFGVNKNGVMEFAKIEGRQMDLIYDTSGNMISSFVVYTKFYKYYHLLKQYQFIQQEEDRYEIKLNLKGDNFAFEDELIADIKLDFGNNARVDITYVDEIPALASGKRRKVINNFKKY